MTVLNVNNKHLNRRLEWPIDNVDKKKLKGKYYKNQFKKMTTYMARTVDTTGKSTAFDILEGDEINIQQNKFVQIILRQTNTTQAYDTKGLYQWTLISPTNPVTREKLSPETLKYIEKRYLAHTQYPDGEVNNEEKEKLLESYIKSKDKLSEIELRMCYCQLDIYDFAQHFRDFVIKDQSEEDERKCASAILETSEDGTWLLRHSSLNRSIEGCHEKGLRYYVISMKRSGKIEHILMIHQLGKGWAKAGIVEGVKIEEISNENQIKVFNGWYPWFLLLLDKNLQEYGLNFNDVNNHYHYHHL